ncbi:MAG: hypothetical protein E4G98_05710 [Promethearchaeota archaeon]|nr:MAG: hypothetical protein E4G98_05710 [Candidatus Lokiarchaeota archaeon]
MTIKNQLHSVLERMFTIVFPFVVGNKAQTEADYLLENHIVGDAFSKTYEPVIKNLLMQGKMTGEFEFKDVDLIYDAITAIIKRSTVLIHQDLSVSERQREIEEETIRLILKIVV